MRLQLSHTAETDRVSEACTFVCLLGDRVSEACTFVCLLGVLLTALSAQIGYIAP